MGDKPQRSEGTKHSKDSDDWDLQVSKGHVKDGGAYNEEIKRVPLISEVRAFVHYKTERDELDKHLKNEKPIKHNICDR